MKIDPLKLKSEISRIGLTQEQFAKNIGITFGTFRKAMRLGTITVKGGDLLKKAIKDLKLDSSIIVNEEASNRFFSSMYITLEVDDLFPVIPKGFNILIEKKELEFNFPLYWNIVCEDKNYFGLIRKSGKENLNIIPVNSELEIITIPISKIQFSYVIREAKRTF